MTYQELVKQSTLVAQSDKIEVRCLDGKAYKIFDRSFLYSAVLSEALLQTLAFESGIPVPRVHGIEEIDERTAIVSDCIKGNTLSSLIAENPAKRDELLELMTDLQLKIHSCTVSDVKKLKHRLLREIKAAPYIDEVKKYEIMTRLSSMREHNKLCHGNFGPENIIIDSHGQPFVLDWAAATRGNASADVARTYLKLSLSSTENAESYIKMFCEKTGTAKNYVQDWLPIVSASCLSDKKLTEKEKTVMLTWLDVVDYD